MNTTASPIGSDLDSRITEDVLGVEEELVDELVLIDNPFDPSKIKVTTEKKNIDLLVRRIDHGEIDLAPEFQRRARIWPLHKKSQLIESLLLRIPLPVFYVAANPNDDWAVVDGLQRITTIDDFLKNKFQLSGMEYLNIIDGRLFRELDRAMRRRIEETELVINVIQPGTPEDVMINIFKRINTGGTPLTGQEIRNALHKGPVRKYLQTLAQNNSFKRATDDSIKDDRMDAQEMILRFLAFKMTPPSEYKVNDLDTFLNDAMRKINLLADNERDALERDFTDAMDACYAIFGYNAFRKPKISAMGDMKPGRNPISKPLFEAWAVSLSNLSGHQIERIVENKVYIASLFRDLLNDDPDFLNSVSYSTGVPARVKIRFAAIERLLHYAGAFL